MDITGARRSLPGAEAVLELRAVVSNGDYEEFRAHRAQGEHRAFGRASPTPGRGRAPCNGLFAFFPCCVFFARADCLAAAVFFSSAVFLARRLCPGFRAGVSVRLSSQRRVVAISVTSWVRCGSGSLVSASAARTMRAAACFGRGDGRASGRTASAGGFVVREQDVLHVHGADRIQNRRLDAVAVLASGPLLNSRPADSARRHERREVAAGRDGLLAHHAMERAVGQLAMPPALRASSRTDGTPALRRRLIIAACNPAKSETYSGRTTVGERVLGHACAPACSARRHSRRASTTSAPQTLA